jgi:hypothetical protein
MPLAKKIVPHAVLGKRAINSSALIQNHNPWSPEEFKRNNEEAAADNDN